MGSGLHVWFYWQFFTITVSYNSPQSVTVYDSLHSSPDYECLPFLCDWLGSDLRIGHFFSFRCPLINTLQLNTQLLNCLLNTLTKESLEFTYQLSFITSGGPNRGYHIEQLIVTLPLSR
jgi:hypothetical protein